MLEAVPQTYWSCKGSSSLNSKAPNLCLFFVGGENRKVPADSDVGAGDTLDQVNECKGLKAASDRYDPDASTWLI